MHIDNIVINTSTTMTLKVDNEDSGSNITHKVSGYSPANSSDCKPTQQDRNQDETTRTASGKW